MKSDETIEKEKCPNCDSTFRNKKSLERHMEVLLTKDSATQKCELCNFTSCTIFGLMTHKTNVHEGKKPRKCRNCNEKFSSNFQLQIHEKWFDGKTKKCSKCPFESCTPKGLELHYKKCKEIFKSAKELEIHQKESKKIPNTESNNQKSSTEMNEMKDTKIKPKADKNLNKTNVLEDKMPTKCKNCNGKFSSNFQLQTHNKLYDGETKKCSRCPFESCTSKGLEAHVKICNEDIWTKCCKYCRDIFESSKELQIHQKVCKKIPNSEPAAKSSKGNTGKSFQKLLFLHQQIHNMKADYSLNYKLNT